MEQYLIDEIIYSYIIVYIAYINDELISSLNYRKKYTPPQKKKIIHETLKKLVFLASSSLQYLGHLYHRAFRTTLPR